MADRYWVGGTASWDGTAGTKWALTSGGAGGETVPTTADDVFFSSASTGTVTIATGNTGAKSINCTGFTGTITGTAAISVAGSITLVAGMTYSHTANMTITGTGTLTTAGKTFSQVVVNGSGITVTLGSALNTSNRNFILTQGTLDTANFNLTCNILSSSNANNRTINLGSSTVTLNGTSLALDFTNSANLTFNSGTSQINCTNSGGGLNGGDNIFYNVAFTSNSSTGSGRLVTGNNTFNNLSFTTAISSFSVRFNGNQTINGTLTCSGGSTINRVRLYSGNFNVTSVVTAANISCANIDFRDITLAGAAAGSSITSSGDLGGNSGIVFPAAKTVYRVGTDTSWAGSSSWSLNSGGTGSNDNFPLAQDTAVIDNNTALTGTLNFNVTNYIGNLDCSNRTTAITLNYVSFGEWVGSHKLGSGVTLAGSTSSQTFNGRGVMEFVTAGKTIPFALLISAPGGTFKLGDSLTSTSSISMSHGTLDANNFNLTCTSISLGNENTRTVTMGSGLWTLTGTGQVWGINPPNLTINKNTANILLSNNTTTARTFDGRNFAYNKLTIGGATSTSITTLSNGCSFTELASTKTVAHTVRFNSDLGTINTWSITGTLGNVVTVDSTTAGLRCNFTLTNVVTGIDYLSVKDIGELSDNKFYVGANSTDGGNNDNVYFSAPLFNVGNMFAMFASA